MKNKAKNLINGFAIVFFLVPVFASADSITPVLISTGDEVIHIDFTLPATSPNTVWFDPTGSNEGGNLVIPPPYDDTWNNFNPNTFGNGCVSPDLCGMFHVLFIDESIDSTCAQGGTTYTQCLADPSYLGTDITVYIGPAGTVEYAAGVASVSFGQTYGFNMDGVASWMWDNLGQPILGSGIGTLYVMRWYWLGFIAISIIVLFAFLYFRFFKR